ncbi:hypothetical protein BD779DRAFT_600955 [Infundibulicybe gibba]|nr:hypothetical protein BD779DRAFT_600955 [Infundibulicybe gibba]
MMDSYPYMMDELNSLVDDLGSDDSPFQSPTIEPYFAPSWVIEPKLEYFPEIMPASPKQIHLTPEELESLFCLKDPAPEPVPFFEIEADANTYELPFDEYGDHKLAVLRELMTFTTTTPATDDLVVPANFSELFAPFDAVWPSPASSTKTLVGSCEPQQVKTKEEPWDSPELMDLALLDDFDYAFMQRSLRSLVTMDYSMDSDEDTASGGRRCPHECRAQFQINIERHPRATTP